MSLDRVNWQPTCCEWHGDYAEHPLKAGGVTRLKRGPALPDGQVLVCRFGPDNRATDKDADGVPTYVEMSAQDVEAMLA